MRDGEVLLIDEALTPDSSRMWARADYEVGISPPSFDKQILRDWLETLDWNKQYPPPPLDAAVLERVSERYRDVCKTLTGSVPSTEPLPGLFGPLKPTTLRPERPSPPVHGRR